MKPPKDMTDEELRVSFEECLEAGAETILGILILPIALLFAFVAGIGWCIIRADRLLSRFRAAAAQERGK